MNMIPSVLHRQCCSAGSDLGLTVSSRCALAIPAGYAASDENAEEDELFGSDN